MNSRRQLRLNTLAEALAHGPSLHLKDAANILGVSEMTVRRDITASDGRFSYLGGYIVSSGDTSSSLDYFLGREEYVNVELKKEACRNALTLVENRDVIFIDCGTTLPYLAGMLPYNLSLTVVCYSVNVAELICKKTNMKIILLGGEYHPESASFSSSENLELLAKVGINKAFISAGGLHFQNGLSCSNFHEVRIKQTAMSRAVTNILVMDSTKLGKVKAVSFASVKDINVIATDSGITDFQKNELQEHGFKVCC